MVYFFDIDDGDRLTSDSVGMELADAETARREAIAALPDIARDVLPDGDHRTFVCTIRDETGQDIFRAVLSLTAGWLAPGDPSFRAQRSPDLGGTSRPR